MTNSLRAGVDATGCNRLGIATHEIGTHSIRSGAAMAMYLNNVPIFSIMKIGRWKSTAFLDYIRSQIEEFTVDVSTKMLQTTVFRHLNTSSEFLATTSQARDNNKNGHDVGHANAAKMVGASLSRRGPGGGDRPSIKPRFNPNPL